MALEISNFLEHAFYEPLTLDTKNKQNGAEGFLCMLKNIFFSIKHKKPLKRNDGVASKRIPPQLLTKSLYFY